MSVLYLLLGIVLLVAGRKLYWFFCAVAGMGLGLYVGSVALDAQSQTWQIVFAIIGAILGAILAVSLQKLAIGVAGFLAGGYGGIFLWQTLGLADGKLEWIPFIIGGVIGAALVSLVFEYGLIALTSWAGAALICQQLDLTDWVGTAAFLGLLITGVIIQAVARAAERKREHGDRKE